MFVPGQMVHSQPPTCKAVQTIHSREQYRFHGLSGPCNIDVQALMAPGYWILLIVTLLFIEKFC